MDWRTFIQWLFIVGSGASIIGAWLAWASRKNGKETRALLKELHQETISTLERMNRLAEERHTEVIRLFTTKSGS